MTDNTLANLNHILVQLQALNLDNLAADQLVPLARATKAVCEFAGALDAQIQLRAIANGQDVPGVAVKDAIVHRKWHDDEAAAALAQEQFGDKAFKRSLLSPAQMEKLGDEGKMFVAVASYKPEAGKRVVY